MRSYLKKLPRSPWLKYLLMVLLACTVSACLRAPHQQAAPVSDNSNKPSRLQRSHRVRRGETLYAIAWRYGLDFRQIARLNHLKSPYTLRVGQRLALASSSSQKKSASKHARKPSGNRVRAPKAKTKRGSKHTRLSAKTTKKVHKTTKKPSRHRKTGRIRHWRWPATGPVIRKYSLARGSNGIDIAGRKGDAVHAAAGGRVVYVGTGIGAYGKLIIIKHNDDYLTAYGHNSQILVKEGQTIKVGRKIAEMGNTGSRRVMLHFEIRRDGKPVNPRRYLPKR